MKNWPRLFIANRKLMLAALLLGCAAGVIVRLLGY